MVASARLRTLLLGVVALCATATSCCLVTDCAAAITWQFRDGRNIPTGIRNQIAEAMDVAVGHYNFFADYSNNVDVLWTDDPSVTANANFNGRIQFGTKINDWTAMHEMSHILGVGTAGAWNLNRNVNTNRWTGPIAIAALASLDGPGSVLHADMLHFWPYGNNTSPDEPEGHVRMVGALREDMGLSNTTILPSGLIGDYNNDFRVDAIDYAVWRENLASGGRIYNDQSPGSVVPVDYAWWKRFYGRSATPPTAVVPEPAAVGVIAWSLFAFSVRRS